MSAVALLEAIRVLNGLLHLGPTGMVTAQRIGELLERAIAGGRPISADEWAIATAEADVADAHLAATIRRLGEDQP